MSLGDAIVILDSFVRGYLLTVATYSGWQLSFQVKLYHRLILDSGVTRV